MKMHFVLILTFFLMAMYSIGQPIAIALNSDTTFQFPLTSECILDGPPLQYEYPYEITEQQDNSTTVVITISKNCGQTTTINLERRNDSVFVAQSDTGELATCGCFQHFTLTINNLQGSFYLHINNSNSGFPDRLFYTEGISWLELKETGNDMDPPVETIEHYFIEGDTMISGQNYAKIYRYKNKPEYIGCFRESGKKIYYTGMDYHFFETDSEILLYDFTKALGDTVYTLTSSYNTIESIDSILIGGSYRNRYYLHDGQQWIEGIGSTYGFLYPITDIPTSY